MAKYIFNLNSIWFHNPACGIEFIPPSYFLTIQCKLTPFQGKASSTTIQRDCKHAVLTNSKIILEAGKFGDTVFMKFVVLEAGIRVPGYGSGIKIL